MAKLMWRSKAVLQTADPMTGKLPGLMAIKKQTRISSTSVVDYHMWILEDRGYIRRSRDGNGRVIAGTTYLIDKAWVKVEVLGTIDSKGIHV